MAGEAVGLQWRSNAMSNAMSNECKECLDNPTHEVEQWGKSTNGQVRWRKMCKQCADRYIGTGFMVREISDKTIKDWKQNIYDLIADEIDANFCGENVNSFEVSEFVRNMGDKQ